MLLAVQFFRCSYPRNAACSPMLPVLLSPECCLQSNASGALIPGMLLAVQCFRCSYPRNAACSPVLPVLLSPECCLQSSASGALIPGMLLAVQCLFLVTTCTEFVRRQ